MYFLVLVYLLLYIKLDFKVYLRQNMPPLDSSSRRGALATESRPDVRPSAGAPGPGERRRAAAGGGPPVRRGAGDAGERRSLTALEVRAEALAGARPL